MTSPQEETGVPSPRLETERAAETERGPGYGAAMEPGAVPEPGGVSEPRTAPESGTTAPRHGVIPPGADSGERWSELQAMFVDNPRGSGPARGHNGRGCDRGVRLRSQGAADVAGVVLARQRGRHRGPAHGASRLPGILGEHAGAIRVLTRPRGFSSDAMGGCWGRAPVSWALTLRLPQLALVSRGYCLVSRYCCGREMCRRMVVPASPVLSSTRSHIWLTTHSP